MEIATAVPASGGEAAKGEPMGFLGAALFQWVNGKAWIMAISSIAAFTLTSDYAGSVAAIVATFFVASIISSTSWTVFGAALRQVPHPPALVPCHQHRTRLVTGGKPVADAWSLSRDLLRLLHQHLGLADRGVVHQAAIE